MIVPRNVWGAKPPKSRTTRAPSSLKGVVVHWFGSPRQAKNHDGCPALLRSVQAGHMANTAEGYVDIAYNHAVCPHGLVYELRGFGVQTGANGYGQVNRDYAAVVYMAGIGDPAPTTLALDAMRRIITQWQLKGAGKTVRTHGSITGSECPGPYLTRWVERKEWLAVVPLRRTRATVKRVRRAVLRWRHGIPYTEV